MDSSFHQTYGDGDDGDYFGDGADEYGYDESYGGEESSDGDSYAEERRFDGDVEDDEEAWGSSEEWPEEAMPVDRFLGRFGAE